MPTRHTANSATFANPTKSTTSPSPIIATNARRHRVLSSLAATLISCASLVFPNAHARGPATVVSAPVDLEAINNDFRALYRERTQQVLESIPLVLVVQNHTITAVRGQQRRLYPVPLQRYNDARAVVHAALGFHGLMGSLAHTANLSDADWRRVTAFQSHLHSTRAAISHSALSRQEKSQALQVLDILDQAAQDSLDAQQIDVSAIAVTLRRVEPLLSSISHSVGHAHAESMLAVLQKVQADASEQEWNSVLAVVTGPATPRRNNLETAIVASALGKELIGKRIFYSENIFSVDGALSHLQTLVGDQELSRLTFDRPYRMWEDLFAPVSLELLGKPFDAALPH